jgi:hypothetical protein
MKQIEEGLHHGTFDAVVLPAEPGSVMSLLHPKYTVPAPGIVKIPLAYPVARRDNAFAAFLNTWIELKRRDGAIEALTVIGFSVSRLSNASRAGRSCAICCAGPIETSRNGNPNTALSHIGPRSNMRNPRVSISNL